jgi:hypothetical protein
MDTAHSKLIFKQGAVFSADLERQKLHVEDTDPVAFSEEERLAKGNYRLDLKPRNSLERNGESSPEKGR